MRLTARAPGKINLCLFLGGVRPDGRHELVTLFESVSLADTLTLTVLSDGYDDEVVCAAIPGPENLVARALSELRSRGWEGPPVQIEVDKEIPVAAGMGGGSADAAAALRLAVELAPGRPEEVSEIAALLGADVPSQLVPGVALGTGAGEVVEVFGPLDPHAVVLVPQPVALATPSVFHEADRLALPRPAADLEDLYDTLVAALAPGARLPAELLVNDLEPAAISLCPAVSHALEAVRAEGAEHAIVCGSGPTVAGLFWGPAHEARAGEAAQALAERFPGTRAATPVGAEYGLTQVI